MTFSESISTCFNKFFSPYGRASRSEYWWYALFNFFITSAIGFSVGVLIGMRILGYVAGEGLIYLLCLPFNISLFLTGIRRMHDSGRSGWNMMFGIIPIAGAILLIYLLCKRSEPEENEYGPCPISTSE